MLEDFKDSVSSVLKERMVSPLFGSFAIAWCFWNWPLLYYIFTVNNEISVETRLTYIKTHYTTFKHLLFRPLVSSVVLLLIYPLASGLITLFLVLIDSMTKRESFKIQKKMPIPHKDAIALYEKMDKEEERYDRLFKEKDEQILSLHTKIKEVNTEYENASSKYKAQINIQESNCKQNIYNLQSEISSLKELNASFEKTLSTYYKEKQARQERAKKLRNRLLEDSVEKYESIIEGIKYDPQVIDTFLTLDEYMPRDRKMAEIPTNAIKLECLYILQQRGLIIVTPNDTYSFTKLGDELRIFYALS